MCSQMVNKLGVIMKSEYVLILHYLNGHGVARWCTKGFCQSPKEMAEYLKENLDELCLDLKDPYDYYSIERRVGMYDRHDICDGELEDLIKIMQNL